MANVRVIANPVAGAGRGRVVAEELCRALEARGHEVEFLATSKRGDASAFAAPSGADYIVAVGGDGTANEVANGMVASPAAMAIAPVGAANAVAQELGAPRTPDRLVDLITEGATRTMDVGLCGQRRFLLCAGAGLDAAVVKAVHEKRGNRKVRVSSYVMPAARIILAHNLPKIRVAVDGKLIAEDGEYVMVGNCRKASGVFSSTPDARIDDGLLDVCVLRDFSLVHTLTMLAAVLRPGFASRKDVRYCQGRTVELAPAGRETVHLQLDGDPAGTIPATLAILPQTLRVVAPGGRGPSA